MRSNDDKAHSSTDIALGSMVSARTAPYGYTVSLWGSGALPIHSHSFPDVGEIFLFAAGALGGYTLVGLIAHAELHPTPPAVGPERVIAGALNWFAVGAVALLARIPGSVARQLGPFAATTLYLLGAAVELALVAIHPSFPTRRSTGQPERAVRAGAQAGGDERARNQ
jgi:hypothetical protein